MAVVKLESRRLGAPLVALCFGLGLVGGTVWPPAAAAQHGGAALDATIDDLESRGHETSRPALERLVLDQSTSTVDRMQALHLLDGYPLDELEDVYQELAVDPEPEVARPAATRLAFAGNPAGDRALRRLVLVDEPAPRVHAATTLMFRGDPLGLQVILAASDSDDPLDRIYAFPALGDALHHLAESTGGDAEAARRAVVDRLTELALRDPKPPLRRLAVSRLIEAGSSAPRPILESLRRIEETSTDAGERDPRLEAAIRRLERAQGDLDR